MKKQLQILLLFLAFLLFPISQAMAHGVQVAYTQLSNGFLRVYIEHWHGNINSGSLSNNGANITMTYGTTTVTQNLDATGFINNTTLANLPGGPTSISACNNGSIYQANAHNDWVYYDFAPAVCGQAVTITINQGNTALLTEACSNLYPSSVTATFNDNAPPVMNCPDVTAYTSNGYNVSYAVSANDACDPNPSVSYSIVPGSTFTVGSTQVTATATDNLNQSASCTFNVILVDNVPPTAVCQDKTVSLDQNGSATISTIDIDNGSSDAEGSVSLALSNSVFSCSEVGTNTVTLTVTDGNNNTSSCTANVEVLDNPPTAICQDLTVYLDNNGQAAIVPSQIDNGSSDPCGIASISLSIPEGNNGQVQGSATSGSRTGRNLTEIAYTYDGQNYSLTPSNAISSSLVLSTLTAGSGNANRFWNTTSNAMDEATALRVLGDFDLGTAFQDCADPSGVKHDVVFDTPIYPGSGPEIFIVHGGLYQDIQILDDQGNVVQTISNSNNGSNVVVGGSIYTNTFHGYYLRNNTNFQVQQIGLHYNSQSKVLVLDIDPSVVSKIGGIRFGGGGCNYTYEILGFQPSFDQVQELSFDCSNVGTNEVSLVVTNNNGNVATCMSIVTVEDNEKPQISCPSSITVDSDPGKCGAVVCYPSPIASDNCVPATPAGYTYRTSYGNSHYYTANGLMNYATAKANAIAAGGHLAVITSAAENAAIHSAGVGYSWLGGNDLETNGVWTWDNCEAYSYSNFCGNEPNGGSYENHLEFVSGGCWNDLNENATRYSILEIEGASIQQTAGLPQNSLFPLGTTTNTFVVTDASGNTNTCSFDVVVEDNENPNAIAQDITVQLDANGVASIVAGDIDNGSNDACGIKSLSLDNSDFDCDDVVAIPELSNTAGFAGRTVTYNNVTINGQSTRVLDVSPGSGVSLTLNWTNRYTSTYCPGCIQQYYIGLSGDGVNESCLYSGGTRNTFTRNSTISFTAPTTPGVYAVSMGSSLQYNCVTRNFGPRDLCGSNNGLVAIITVGMSNPTVTLSVTDNNDNVSTATANVTVEDNIAPIANCGDITVDLDATGNVSITADDVDNGSTDNCGIMKLSIDKSAFTCSEVGANTVTLTVKDNSFNVSTCTSTVTVEDNVAPEALCQNATVTLLGGTASVSPEDIDNGSNDACGILSLDLDNSNWDCTNIGDNPVTLTVTDNNNNESTCDATVTVIGKIPTVEVTQAELQQFCQGGTLELTATAGEGTMFTYAWTPTAETTDIIYVDESDTYGVKVTNEFGCFVRGGIDVEYERSDLLASYTILATDKKVELKKGSHVQTGGVGVFGYKYKYYLKGKEYEDKIDGEIKVKYESSITGPTTFARAVEIDVEEGSTVTTQINSIPDVEIPEFVYNPHCKDKDVEDVKVKKDEEVTLTGSVYGKVDVDKGGKVTFTNSTIYLEDLQTNYDVTIDFTAPCVNMVVCDKVDLKKNNSFNPNNSQVLMYLEKGLKVDKNSTVNSSVFTLYSIDVNGGDEKKDESTKMTGMFIAKDVKSDNAVWNWRPECNACEALSNKTGAEPETHTLQSLAEEELITINLYPNPNNGNFGLDVFAENDGMMNVTVFDMFGKEIYTIDNQELSGFTYVPISLDGVRRAQYFVRVTIDGKVFTKAVFVNP